MKNVFNADPGLRNELADVVIGGTVSGKLYSELVCSAVASINHQDVQTASRLLKTCIDKSGVIYTAGNGGSLAIAHHSACDLGKGLYRFYPERIRVTALGTNAATCSALANDFGFDSALAAEYEMLRGAGPSIVVAVSSSGTSTNIIKLCEAAKARGDLVIGLTGFSGGTLKDSSDLCFHVPLHIYPAIELVHQHILDLILLDLWQV